MAYLPVILIVVALVGVALYVFAANPKLQELGRLTFAAAAFAFCFSLTRLTV